MSKVVCHALYQLVLISVLLLLLCNYTKPRISCSSGANSRGCCPSCSLESHTLWWVGQLTSIELSPAHTVLTCLHALLCIACAQRITCFPGMT